MQLEGKVAVVTGAGGGTGAVIAEALAAQGVVVVVADIEHARAVEVCTTIRDRGGSAHPVRADVCAAADVDAVIGAAVALGGPHILVNNAGGWGSAGRQYPDANVDEWDAVLDLNLRAPMVLTQLCLPLMAAAGGGAVVNIASSAGVEDTAYASPEYGTAKAGLIRFTTCLADLDDRMGVRVNCVVPNWIGLERAHQELARMTPEQRASAAPLIPPEQVAHAVLAFVADDGLSGRVVVLRGGRAPELLQPTAADG